MDKKIYIKRGCWGKIRQDRYGVIVEVRNGQGQPFYYMPTYEDMREIARLLNTAEELNKGLSK